MDTLITSEEILEAIKLIKVNKSPGRDALPGEFYKTFAETLAPSLAELCNLVMKTGKMPPSWAQARIIIIPKPEKDLTSAKSYRLISLLN